MLQLPTQDNKVNQSNASYRSNRQKIFEQPQTKQVIKPQGPPLQQLNKGQAKQEVLYQSNQSQQSYLVGDNSEKMPIELPGGVQDKKMHDLIKHMKPGNIESLMALLNLQRPIELTIASQRAGQATQLKTSMNQQIPAYVSNYYHQIDSDAEKVRERIKEESKVVNYIIGKHRKLKDTHDRLKKECEQLNIQLKSYHKQHKEKVFKKQVKYTFQQLESKADEMKDFYEEVYSLMELFSVAAHEQQYGQAPNYQGTQPSFFSSVKQQVTQAKPTSNLNAEQAKQPDQSTPQKNLGASQTDQSHIYPIENSQSKGAELLATALKLYSELEHYSKQIETTLSEQRRLQSISQNNQEFKQISQSLLTILQMYPGQEAKTKEDLNRIYVLNAQYLKALAVESKDILLELNEEITQFRESLSGIERLQYVHSKFADLSPQFLVYYEALDKMLQGQDLSMSNEDAIPHPRTLNSPLLQQMSQLHGQFKQSHITAQGHRYFTNMKMKVFKKCQESIQSQKAQGRDINDHQEELYNVICQTITDVKYTTGLLTKVEQAKNSVQNHLSRDGVRDLEQYFHELNGTQSCLTIRQHKIFKMRKTSDNIHYQNILDRVDLAIKITLEKLNRYSVIVDYYMSLGDLDALIDFNELQETMQTEESKLIEYLYKVMRRLGQTMRSSTDVDQFSNDQIQLKKRLLPSQDMVSAMQALLNKQLNESIKCQIRVVLAKWDQIKEVSMGLDTLLDAVQFLSVQNMQNISEEFKDTDTQTSIGQFEELSQEQEKNVQKVSEKANLQCWTCFKAQDYESLVHGELEGYRWILKLFSCMLNFQKGLASVYKKFQPVISSLQNSRVQQSQQGQMEQQQNQFKPASGNYFNQKKSNQSASQYQESAYNSLTPVGLQDLLQFLVDQPFSDVQFKLFCPHPNTQRWLSYQKILTRQLNIVYETYFIQTFYRVDTLGGGIVLSQGQFDINKANLTANWIRRINSASLLEAITEILSGVSLSQPDIVDELFEYVVMMVQIYDKVKRQLDSRSKKGVQLSPQENDFQSQDEVAFDQNLKDIAEYMTAFIDGIGQVLQNIEVQGESIRLFLQVDNQQLRVNKVAPLICSALAQINPHGFKDLIRTMAYVNEQVDWIQNLILWFSQEIDILNSDLLIQSSVVNTLLVQSPFRPLAIKETLDLLQVNSGTYLGNCQTRLEKLMLNDDNKQDMADLIRFIQNIQKYQEFDQIVKVLLVSLQNFEDSYIKPLEQQGIREQPKLSYLPQSFIEQVYDRLDQIEKTCQYIYQGFQSYSDHCHIGCIKFDLSKVRGYYDTLIRWGSLVQTILLHIMPDAEQYFRQDFTILDNLQIQSNELQLALENAWNSINQ